MANHVLEVQDGFISALAIFDRPKKEEVKDNGKDGGGRGTGRSPELHKE